MSALAVSVVIPVLDEEDNLGPLHDRLVEALEPTGRSWEVIYCDDGSTDGSLEVLRGLAARDDRVRVLSFRRNFGQTAALSAGFDHARGAVVVAMDADLQNDPADIPALLDKIDEGYDLVSGWRAHRQDKLWTVTLPSRLGNALIRRVTGVPLHDFGCTLTAYRREVLQDVKLYGEMHRFIPAWLAAIGARITELPVRHHPRLHGKSKYTVFKAFRVILDLMTVRFLAGYATKPLYFFGRIGLGLLGLAGGLWTWTIAKKLIWGDPLFTDPFFYAGIFAGLAALQFLFFGLLSELIMRTYFESQGKPTYSLRETINLAPSAPPRARPQRPSEPAQPTGTAAQDPARAPHWGSADAGASGDA